MELQIDDGFRLLMLPLTNEERSQLEENLIADGCRDALVVWRLPTWTPEGWGRELYWDHPDRQEWYKEAGSGEWEWRSWEIDDDGGDEVNHSDWPHVLIDGHNRYEICMRLDIDFETVVMEFDSRDDVEDWIDKNQSGRRNATPEQLSLIRGRRYNRAKRTMAEAGAMKGASDNLSTASAIAQQHGVDEKTIRRDGKFAEAVEALDMQSEIASGEIVATKAAIVEAAKPIVDANKAHAKWEEDAKQRPLTELPEPPRPTAENVQKAKAHVSHNSGENEWYTPPEYIDSARNVLGVIDCDPASSAIANETVNASVYFTKDDDGLTKRWFGNVWLNPPYAQPLIAQFADAVATKYESGEIVSAIVLVNNATETAWFQRMASVADAICFPKGRVRFLDPQGNPGAPLQGQAVLYFGKDALTFLKEYQSHGSAYTKQRI